MSPLIQSLLLAATTAAMAAANSVPPSTGNEWMSLDKGVEFQPASVSDPIQQRELRKAQDRFLAEESSAGQQTSFVDSTETYYDGYAQAWRYVGFYTDCNPVQEDGRRRRKLNEDEENACVRYLLWAAYVDLGYTGLGIGEYQFWDTYKEFWDTSACETIGNVDEDGTVDPTTCKKMDCHMPETETWQLLGYFKEPYYTDWFEQLFKHQSYCVWQGNEYNFMYDNYGAWPEGCTETEVYLSDGTALYYDTKAEANATMTYGLYTDWRCSQDYTGDEITVAQLLNAEGGDDLLSLEYLDYWNEAMEIHRVCQPCRAYALHEGYGGNEGRQLSKQKRRLEDNDPNNGYFQCDDAAGYTNVNQCMKFRSKTDMYYCSLEEVMEASFQGGITTVTIDERSYGEYRAGHVLEEEAIDWTLFYIALATLLVGIAALTGATLYTRGKCRKIRAKSLKQPLITEL